MGYRLAQSFSIAPLVELTPTSKAVLAAMSYYANDRDQIDDDGKPTMVLGGNIYPSTESLCLDTGFSKATIKSSTKRLRDARIIRYYETRRDMKDNKGVYFHELETPLKGISNCYQINTTMLARVLDARATLMAKKVKVNNPDYSDLLRAAMTYRDGDFDYRVFQSSDSSKPYSGTVLQGYEAGMGLDVSDLCEFWDYSNTPVFSYNYEQGKASVAIPKRNNGSSDSMHNMHDDEDPILVDKDLYYYNLDSYEVGNPKKYRILIRESDRSKHGTVEVNMLNIPEGVKDAIVHQTLDEDLSGDFYDLLTAISVAGETNID